MTRFEQQSMDSVSLKIVSVEVTARPRKFRLSVRKAVNWRGKKMCFRQPWTIEND